MISLGHSINLKIKRSNPQVHCLFLYQPKTQSRFSSFLPPWLQHLLEVSVLVFAVGLQDDGDDGHEWFDHTELQGGLLTEAQEADGVGLSPQAAGTVHTAGPDGTELGLLLLKHKSRF